MQRRAFTLIELLVVIGVIAVLVALLLPALSTVKRNIRQTRCVTNLRSQTQLVLAYSNDYTDSLPPRVINWNRAEPDGTYTSSTWTLPRLLADWQGDPFLPIPPAGVFYAPVGIWRCTEIPQDDDLIHSTHLVIAHSAANRYLFNNVNRDDEVNDISFGQSSLPGWLPTNPKWIHAGDVQRPSDILTFCDALTFYFSFHGHRHALESIGKGYELVPGTPRDNQQSHQKTSKIATAFLDGHSALLPTDDDFWNSNPHDYPGPSGGSAEMTHHEAKHIAWYVSPK